jgi:hypothetical protein
LLVALLAAATVAGSWVAAAITGLAAATLIARELHECGAGFAVALSVIEDREAPVPVTAAAPALAHEKP